MNKLLLLALFCLFSISGAICLQAYQSAHVITVGIDLDKKGKETKRYVLFGRLTNGKLSTFGGLRDPGEKDPKKTAAREAEEEALGVLGNRTIVLKLLKGVDHFFEADGHLCYVLPKQNYGKDVSARFKKIRFDKKIKLTNSQKEMVDIVAVEVDKIREKVLKKEYLQFEDNEGTLCPLRVPGVFVEAVLGGHL